ncbi:MAG: hypothetical protein WC010_00045 [Candidatus Absconditabacterales bacterium]
MVNKPQQPAKHVPASNFFKSITLTGAMLLFLLKPGISKNNEGVKAELQKVLEAYPTITYKVQESNKIAKFERKQNTEDALKFATENVNKYYPDMKDYLDGMINQFGKNTERKNVVDSILIEAAMKISNSKQRVGAIIYALEKYVFRKSTFSEKYYNKIDNETLLIMGIARIQYDKRLNQRNTNIAEINAEIEKNKEQLENNKEMLEINRQELENILNKITVEDIKGRNIKEKEGMRDIVTKIKVLYNRYELKTTIHVNQLFRLVH